MSPPPPAANFRFCEIITFFLPIGRARAPRSSAASLGSRRLLNYRAEAARKQFLSDKAAELLRAALKISRLPKYCPFEEPLSDSRVSPQDKRAALFSQEEPARCLWLAAEKAFGKARGGGAAARDSAAHQ